MGEWQGRRGGGLSDARAGGGRREKNFGLADSGVYICCSQCGAAKNRLFLEQDCLLDGRSFYLPFFKTPSPPSPPFFKTLPPPFLRVHSAARVIFQEGEEGRGGGWGGGPEVAGEVVEGAVVEGQGGVCSEERVT